MMYKSQFRKIDPDDRFSGPGSQIRFEVFIYKNRFNNVFFVVVAILPSPTPKSRCIIS